MKNFKKLSGISLRAGFISLALSLSAHTFAGTYTSTVKLPTLHSKNHVYTAPMPIPVGVGEGFIKNISWNWNVHGWPRGLQVYLCQTSTRCIDVSRQRVGSKAAFTQFHSSQPFFYELKLSDPGRVPVAGLVGRLTVNW
jgi:flagellar protein FlhE